MKVKVTCEYTGTLFSGWERQPDKRTVQEEIENVLSHLYHKPITIYAAGRTDAGVHALGQVFHYEIDEKRSPQVIKRAMNLILNSEIYIKQVQYVNDNFHARYSAKGKEYLYKFETETKDPFNKDLVYICPYKLDMKLLKDALMLFKGEHNFKNFTSKEEDEAGFVRKINNISLNKVGDHYEILFKGTGFMRYQVRYMVGTAFEVARGKIPLSFISENLDSDEPRRIVSYKAHAEGLYLKKVCY
ncbi:MAG: tRNA pseudouridine(38-40) synthase TruA [Coprobacillus sp.]|nr:tRNA pseudouridine(38-40) synthase TruA [Coprobacillus sp.]